MTQIKTKIPAELEPAAVGGMVTDSKYVKDRVKNKTQEEVNADTEERVSALEESVGTGGSVDERIAIEKNRAEQAEGTLDGKIATEKTRAEGVEGGLNTRLQTVEQLASISVGGGDIGIGTAADFESDDPEDVAKVPTIGAMLGGANDGVYDISARHNGTKYADLSAALGVDGANVPVGVRKGGMSVKYIQTFDNNYVEYVYTGTVTEGTPNPFLDIKNWYSITKTGIGNNSDLLISDDIGNVLAEFREGHFRTKSFDSESTLKRLSGAENEIEKKAEVAKSYNADLNIGDENENFIAEFKDGHFRTKFFDSEQNNLRLEQLENEINSIYFSPYRYIGEKIDLGTNSLYSKEWKSFTGLPMIQSFAIYNDYIVFLYGAPNYGKGSLWQLSTSTKLADISFPSGTYSAPHGNVANFSKMFVEGNADLPLLYISQWDNEGGCFVYDIHLDGTCSLIQTIMTGNMGSAFGLNLGDWVLDVENNYIWSAKYKVSAYHASGNGMMFCKFVLPSIENPSVVLSESDILDSFEISDNTADLTITQDKIINNGKMFIICGYGSSNDIQYPASLYVINLSEHKVSSYVDIDEIYPLEPEGMDIYHDMILYNFGGSKIYCLIFNK